MPASKPAAKKATAPELPTFKMGDIVTWRSAAMGSWKEKTGTVVAVVPVKHDPPGLSALPGGANHYRGAYGSGWPRDHESYLVVVPGGKTAAAKGVVYWPIVSKLSKARPGKPQGVA